MNIFKAKWDAFKHLKLILAERKKIQKNVNIDLNDLLKVMPKHPLQKRKGFSFGINFNKFSLHSQELKQFSSVCGEEENPVCGCCTFSIRQGYWNRLVSVGPEIRN